MHHNDVEDGFIEPIADKLWLLVMLTWLSIIMTRVWNNAWCCNDVSDLEAECARRQTSMNTNMGHQRSNAPHVPAWGRARAEVSRP